MTPEFYINPEAVGAGGQWIWGGASSSPGLFTTDSTKVSSTNPSISGFSYEELKDMMGSIGEQEKQKTEAQKSRDSSNLTAFGIITYLL